MVTPRSTLQLAIILGVGGYFAHLAWSLWRRALDGTLEGREGWYELATVMSTSRGGGYGAGDFEEIDLSRDVGGGDASGGGDAGGFQGGGGRGGAGGVRPHRSR